MNQSSERQFRKADAAIDRAVRTFASEVNEIMGKGGGVAPSYVAQSAVLAMADELIKLIDDPIHVDPGPELLKLSNALHDYRDAR